MGICSGAARIGAIVGIVMDEMKLLHPNLVANIIAGAIFLLSGLLIRILPDCTKSNLPVTWDDVAKIENPIVRASDPESKS